MSGMLTLYQFSTSPFTEKVTRALNYTRLPYEVHEVVREDVPKGTYKHVSATGKFPAMRDEEDVIWDSTDILIHINMLSKRQSTSRYIIPENPKKQALAHIIEDWADESIYFYEVLMRLSWPHNLENALDEFAESMPHVPKDQLKELIISGTTKLTTAQGLGRKPKEQIVDDVERHFNAIEQLLEGEKWLAGTLHPSNADFAVAGQLSALLYASEAKELYENCENIKAWRDRLDAIAPKDKEEPA